MIWLIMIVFVLSSVVNAFWICLIIGSHNKLIDVVEVVTEDQADLDRRVDALEEDPR